jgi:hypothetical protein
VPGLIAEYVPKLIDFFREQLMAEVLPARYYWNSITNIISAVLQIAISVDFQGAFEFGGFIRLILARLPVCGDLEEAEFIYMTLIGLFDATSELFEPHTTDFFRVLTETIASKDVWTAAAEAHPHLVRVFIALADTIPNAEDEASMILGGDPLKFGKLQSRIQVQ